MRRRLSYVDIARLLRVHLGSLGPLPEPSFPVCSRGVPALYLELVHIRLDLGHVQVVEALLASEILH